MIRAFGTFILCLLVSLPAFAALPTPTPELYVNDYANVLSEKNRTHILEQSRALQQTSGAQIAVLTVPSLEGDAIREYGHKVASSWKLGNADKNNGLLIVLAVQDRKIDVEVGYGLEGCLPDARVGRAIDSHAIPAFKNGDFDTGLVSLYDALLAEVRAEYGLAPKPEENGSGEDDFDGMFSAVLLFVVIPFFLVCFALCFIGMIVDLSGIFFSPEKRANDPLTRHFFLYRWFRKGLRLILHLSSNSNDPDDFPRHRGSGGSGSSGSSGGGGNFGGGGASRGF